MNAAANAPLDSPHRLPSPTRPRRWLVWALMVVVFVSGLGIGAGGALLIVRNRLLELIQNPQLAMPELAARIGYRLSLTPDQVTRVEKILLARERSIDAIRRRVQPQIVAELDKLEQEVADVLDPAQRQKWHDLCSHLRRTWLPHAVLEAATKP